MKMLEIEVNLYYIGYNQLILVEPEHLIDCSFEFAFKTMTIINHLFNNNNVTKDFSVN